MALIDRLSAALIRSLCYLVSVRADLLAENFPSDYRINPPFSFGRYEEHCRRKPGTVSSRISNRQTRSRRSAPANEERENEMMM